MSLCTCSAGGLRHRLSDILFICLDLSCHNLKKCLFDTRGAPGGLFDPLQGLGFMLMERKCMILGDGDG